MCNFGWNIMIHFGRVIEKIRSGEWLIEFSKWNCSYSGVFAIDNEIDMGESDTNTSMSKGNGVVEIIPSFLMRLLNCSPPNCLHLHLHFHLHSLPNWAFLFLIFLFLHSHQARVVLEWGLGRGAPSRPSACGSGWLRRGKGCRHNSLLELKNIE